MADSSLLQKLRQQAALFDDAAWEAIANKGLLRRARKDLSQEVPTLIKETDTTIQLSLADETVTLSDAGIARAVCTCPATGVCRHILMVGLWLAAGVSEVAAEPPAGNDPLSSECENFTAELLDFGLDELTKWAGKKTVRAAIELLGSGQSPQITEAVPLLVHFPSLNTICRIFPGRNLEGILCSCKAQSVCRHRVAAVLAYQQFRGRSIAELDSQTPVLQAATGAPRNRAQVLTAVKRVLEEVVAIGLCHLSDSRQQRLSTLAMSALGVNLPRLSLALRSLADGVRLSLERDARADDRQLFLAAARTYALCAALEHVSRTAPTANSPPTASALPPAELIGWHRSHYEEVGTLELVGVGAYPWFTQSGYAGLTVLFWDIPNRCWCSWSDTRSTFQGSRFDPHLRYVQATLWQGQSPAHLSRSHFRLLHARKNYQNRLSAAAQTSVHLLGQMEMQALDFGDRGLRDWQQLRSFAASVPAIGLQEYDPLREIAVLYPIEWGEKQFDPVQQQFTWMIHDAQGQGVPLQVAFSPVDEPRIKTLEALEPELVAGAAVVVQVRLTRSGLFLSPISLLTSSRVMNLGFAEQPAVLLRGAPPEPENAAELDGIELPDADPLLSEWNSPLEQRIDRLIDELQRIAEQGSHALTPATQQQLTSEVQWFRTAGLETIAHSLEQLIHPSTPAAAQLLKLRYLCQLCQEVSVKAAVQNLG